MSRKTKLITFNLKDNGRIFTGQDRSNIDLKAWVDLINSPQSQEMISTGGMFGYYGHQIRQLFGMYPSETEVIGDKILKISPAIRTVELKADQDGTVSHRVEFLETPEGEHAYRQYKAKVGGFSMACDFKNVMGKIFPTLLGGFDYVLQPNYVNNTSHGMFDSANPLAKMIKQNLELSVTELYDCIHSCNYAQFSTEEAAAQMLEAAQLENKFMEEMAKIQRREKLQHERQQQILDSALCPTVPFGDFLNESNQFLDLKEEKTEQKKDKTAKTIGGVFDWF